MREVAAPALPAVRSIARISWRVDIVPGSSLVSPVNLTDSGKARVNREAACSGKRARKSSVDGDRSEVLTGCSYRAALSGCVAKREARNAVTKRGMA